MSRKLAGHWLYCGGMLRGQIKVTEKLNSEDQLDLEPLVETPISSTTEEPLVEDTVLDRQTEIVAEWDHRSNNPNNKPLDPSVTEEYYTKGGKEIRAVHDDERTLDGCDGGILDDSILGSGRAGQQKDRETCRNAAKGRSSVHGFRLL